MSGQALPDNARALALVARRLLRAGLDSAEIARWLGVRECQIWNAWARSGDG